MSGMRRPRVPAGGGGEFREIAVGSAPRIGREGVRAGLSLAAAGDMDLAKRSAAPRRAKLLSLLGVAGERAYAVRQVHSRTVVLVDDRGPGAFLGIEADGFVTGRPDALLTVTVADCLPIYFLDPVTGAFGLVHSGWRGTGIAVEAVRMMAERFGARPADLQVTIGPGIGPCCYHVSRERCDAFAADFGEESVLRAGGEDFRLDLRSANLGLLRGAGVEDVAVVSDCTCCTPGLGSFRREGPGRFTRMLAFIGRRAGAR